MSRPAPTTSPAGGRGVLSAAWLAADGGERLARFLAGRRWFAGKGGRIGAVRVRDVIPLFAGSAVARVEVAREGGAFATYQIPLALRGDDADASQRLCRVEAREGGGAVVDALTDLAFLRDLGRAFADGRRFSGEQAAWIVDRVGRAFENPRVVGVEQSNSSILYGRDGILKLYRRLAPGINPDVEIGRFLTARDFAYAPRLHGTILFEDGDGSQTVAGSLQEFVASIGDGWEVALEAASAAIAGRAPVHEQLAGGLGRATRALHDELAAGREEAFRPRPILASDIASLSARVHGQIDRSLDLAAAAAGREAAAAERLTAIAGRRVAAHRRADRLLSAFAAEPGTAIRHHGDLHLGQALVGEDGRLVLVDFEGEPARPLAERRARASALRDVAGMLRSFGYAARVAAGRVDRVDACGRAAAWEASSRRAFLDAYFAAETPGTFLPRSAAGRSAGLDLFELEKAFYELEYELENRPDWVETPLDAIERILDGD